MLICIGEITQPHCTANARPRREVMAYDFSGRCKPGGTVDVSLALTLGVLLPQRLQFVFKAATPAGDRWFPVSRA
jgi:hypothetical protein